MKREKRTVKRIANKYQIEPDELLLRYWYKDSKKFEYLRNENSFIKNKDLRFAKDLAGQKSRTSPKKNIQRKFKNRAHSKNEKRKTLEYVVVSPEIKTYDFSLGRVNNEIKYLTKYEIVKIHQELENDFRDSEDPIYPSGIKNEANLEMAVYHSQTQFEGRLKYRTIEASGAALLYAISQNHCFHNGNKRTSIVALLVFLDKHNIDLICDEDILFKVSVMIADHKMVDEDSRNSDAEINEIMKWVHCNCKLRNIGERIISKRRLCQILNNFDCRINGDEVERTVIRKGILRQKNEVLRTRIPSIQNGKDINIDWIKGIREDLELDAEHGIDLDAFYNRGEFSASEFINKYKGLLRRLSRF